MLWVFAFQNVFAWCIGLLLWWLVESGLQRDLQFIRILRGVDSNHDTPCNIPMIWRDNGEIMLFWTWFLCCLLFNYVKVGYLYIVPQCFKRFAVPLTVLLLFSPLVLGYPRQMICKLMLSTNVLMLCSKAVMLKKKSLHWFFFRPAITVPKVPVDSISNTRQFKTAYTNEGIYVLLQDLVSVSLRLHRTLSNAAT